MVENKEFVICPKCGSKNVDVYARFEQKTMPQMGMSFRGACRICKTSFKMQVGGL